MVAVSESLAGTQVLQETIGQMRWAFFYDAMKNHHANILALAVHQIILLLDRHSANVFTESCWVKRWHVPVIKI